MHEAVQDLNRCRRSLQSLNSRLIDTLWCFLSFWAGLVMLSYEDRPWMKIYEIGR